MTTATCLKNIPYLDSGNPKHSLDIFIPETPASEKLSDIILVFIHGGAWRTGDKSEYEWLGQQFASMGIYTVNLTYRLSTKSQDECQIIHPSHVQDCAHALRFLYGHGQDYFKFKVRKMCLVGHSAGAQINGILTLIPSYLESLGSKELWSSIKGVVGVEGIYDIPSLINTWPDYMDFIELAFMRDKNLWISGSPQHQTLPATKTTDGSSPTTDYLLPPYLILHSLEDELVDRTQADRFAEHLRTMRSNVELDFSMVGKHDPMLREIVFFERVKQFMNEKL